MTSPLCCIGNTSGSGNDWNNTNPNTGNSWNFASNNYVKNNFGRINSITWQKVYDSRDNIYDPTRGRRISYTTQWAGHGLGGDFDFYKFTAETRMYKKLGAKNVLAFRAPWMKPAYPSPVCWPQFSNQEKI